MKLLCLFALLIAPAVAQEAHSMRTIIPAGNLSVWVARGIPTLDRVMVVVALQTKSDATTAFRIRLCYSLDGKDQSVQALRPRDWSFGPDGYTQESFWIPKGAKALAFEVSEEQAPYRIELQDDPEG